MARFLNYILARVGKKVEIDPSLSWIDVYQYFSVYMMDYIRGLTFIRIRKSGSLFVGKGTRIFFKRKITIGKTVKIGNYCTISGLGKDGLIIGNNVSIANYCRIIVSTNINNLGEVINLGDDVGIGEFSSIGGSGGVKIGNKTIIAQYFSAHPENHNFEDLTVDIKDQGTTRKAITIGSNCWIGSKVTVLSGVSVGDGCVIGAGTLVNKNIPANSIAVGNPIRVISKR